MTVPFCLSLSLPLSLFLPPSLSLSHAIVSHLLFSHLLPSFLLTVIQAHNLRCHPYYFCCGYSCCHCWCCNGERWHCLLTGAPLSLSNFGGCHVLSLPLYFSVRKEEERRGNTREERRKMGGVKDVMFISLCCRYITENNCMQAQQAIRPMTPRTTTATGTTIHKKNTTVTRIMTATTAVTLKTTNYHPKVCHSLDSSPALFFL